MPTGTQLLAARGIGRRHREENAWLLRNVSLEIAAGDRVVLTGLTGSGKTVLLRSLAMLDAIDEGAIFWQGKPILADSVPAYRAEAIYLTQRPQLFDGTVEQNLRIPHSLAIHRHRQYSRASIGDYLNQLGRDDAFLDQDAALLSGGEMQIVALLRAVQLDPRLLLLDEPTASLDENTTQQIERLVADWISLASSRRALVWVTHDAAQAQRIANRAWQLRDGELVEEGVDS